MEKFLEYTTFENEESANSILREVQNKINLFNDDNNQPLPEVDDIVDFVESPENLSINSSGVVEESATAVQPELARKPSSTKSPQTRNASKPWTKNTRNRSCQYVTNNERRNTTLCKKWATLKKHINEIATQTGVQLKIEMYNPRTKKREVFLSANHPKKHEHSRRIRARNTIKC